MASSLSIFSLLVDSFSLGFHHQSFESVIKDERLRDRDETETGKVCENYSPLLSVSEDTCQPKCSSKTTLIEGGVGE